MFVFAPAPGCALHKGSLMTCPLTQNKVSRIMANPSDILAAIDLGSNSFHMIIARVGPSGQLQRIDRIKDMVRLGGGLDEHNNLSAESRQRGIDALARFGERLRELPSASVRAVGTNTLRKAKNSREFLLQLSDALGHPIEIISGHEEGRLIHVGVAHGIFDPKERKRIVVDIGGGSTEVIIGQGFDALAVQSHYMGCVSYSQRFFPEGKVTAKSFERATLAARQELVKTSTTFPQIGWESELGTSGTIKAIQQIILAEGLGELGITLQAMYALRDRMISIKSIAKLSGLKEERIPVIPGGLAILIGTFESLGLTHMSVSDMALREGVLYDLHGRMINEDVRDHTIMSMAARYGVDMPHAERVASTALSLWDRVKLAWAIDNPTFGIRLRWACLLHEIGLAISHTRHHKHGSYLVENSDMAGFSRQDQQLLWALIRSHRRRLKPHRFDSMPGSLPEQARRLCLLLRLAVVLNRTRSPEGLPPELCLSAQEHALTLTLPQTWLEASPLTHEDLLQERDYISAAGYTLDLVAS